jgi:hypothetical protein
MLTLLLALIIPAVQTPTARVEAGPVEAVYLPASWSGPIVAAPFSERAFE